MKAQYHILNGDALKHQFPTTIDGTLIVARECMVDGNVSGDTSEAIFESRIAFMNANYSSTTQMYHEKVVSEFFKLKSIPVDAEINLWFEDDLFCQCNFWFVLFLIEEYQLQNQLYLIRPQVHTRYGFAGLDQEALLGIYATRIKLPQATRLTPFWKAYQKQDSAFLLTLAKQFYDTYPFFLPAIEAYSRSLASNDSPGEPLQALITIKKELNTTNFGIVFNEFSKRFPIYGFGDLQVKRLWDQIN
ncbi:DUF1835 domain-containing protein [Aquimarina rhabdastrellae]